MDVLRTPDARFEELADWPYAPRYVEVGQRPIKQERLMLFQGEIKDLVYEMEHSQPAPKSKRKK